MAKKKLTQRDVDSAQPTDERRVIWDVPWPFGQFGLRIYPSGVKSYIVRWRDDGGTKHFQTVGQSSPAYGLKQARADAFVLLNEIEDEQQSENANPSIDEIAEHYIERLWQRAERASRTKETVETDERRIRQRFLGREQDGTKADVDSSIQAAGRDALSITTRELKGLHTSITEGEGHAIEANRVRSVFIAMWNNALEWGLLPTGSPNPAAPVTPNPEPERLRVLQPEEFAPLGRELVRVSNDNPRIGLWLLLLTGQRKNEVMSLEWANVDFDHLDMRFVVTKTDTINRVPMGRVVAQILRGHLERQIEDGRWVFPSPRTDSYQGNVESTWRGRRADDPNCVRSRAGLNHEDKEERLTLHDFRRTFATYAYELGATHYVIQECLGHKLQTTLAKHYQRSDEPSDAAREVMNQYAEWVLAKAEVQIEQIVEGVTDE